jgi:very-short-patch-repair endonuclease
MLTDPQYTQYSLAYLYMSYYRATTLDNVMTQGKQALRENLRQSLNNKPLQSPNPSKLQKQVERCIRQKLKFRVESEKVINGLPVDMYLPDHHAIVQVNGPSHYVYKDSEQNRQLSIKDRFHEAIVQMPAITSTTVMPDYKIIHIDYQQFSQNGKSYIENQLRQAGLLKGKVTNLGVFADHNQQKQSSQLTSVKRNEQRFTA